MEAKTFEILGKEVLVTTDEKEYHSLATPEADMPSAFCKTNVVSDIRRIGSTPKDVAYYKDGAIVYLAPESICTSDMACNVKMITEASVKVSAIICRQLGLTSTDIMLSSVTSGFVADSLMKVLKKIVENFIPESDAD